MEFTKHKHSVYCLVYHAVFVVKYRRPALTPEMNDYLKALAARLIQGYGGTLMELECDKDHVHLLMQLPPSCAPGVAVNNLKTQMSKCLRRDFADDIAPFLWGGAFWSASYFICTTGGASIEAVRQYIERQPTEAHQKRKYVKSGRYKKNS